MKAQSKERIAQLMVQWPVIEDYLRRNNRNWPHDQSKDVVFIKVERADENLLLAQPDFANGKTWVLHNPENSSQIGSRYEVISAVNAEHKIISTIGSWNPATWPQGRIRDLHPLAEKLAAESLQHYDHRISYIVRMVVISYYQEREQWWKDSDDPKGEFAVRKVFIRIYRAPKKRTFEQLFAQTDLATNVRLSRDEMITSNHPDRDNAYADVQKKLLALGSLFEEKVYRNGMRKLIDACGEEDMCGSFGETRLLSYTSRGSGRIYFRLERGSDFVMFCTAQNYDVPGTGWWNINTTLPAAEAMVDEVVAEWNNSTVPLKKRYRHDPQVRLALS